MPAIGDRMRGDDTFKLPIFNLISLSVPLPEGQTNSRSLADLCYGIKTNASIIKLKGARKNKLNKQVGVEENDVINGP